MRRLVIDDLRVLQLEGEVVYARTPEFGLALLLEEGPWDEVYLDHDMGVTDTKRLCATLEELALDDEEPDIGKIFIITGNSVAANWMYRALSLYEVEVIPFIKCEWITLSESIDAQNNERAAVDLRAQED